MELSISQYLANPHGKGAATSGLKAAKDEYDARYEALIHIHEEFETKVYQHKGMFYVHLQIPSETKNGIDYDIVIKFNKGKTSDTSLLNLPIQVICNSPSFVFTYAYVFKREKLLIEELKSVITNDSIKDAPNTRNPYKILGLEKTLYYACKYIRENYPDREDVTGLAEPLDLRQMKADIIAFPELMKMINAYQKKASQENKKAKMEKQKELNNILHSREHVIDNTKSIERVRGTSNVTKASKAKTAKKVKRI